MRTKLLQLQEEMLYLSVLEPCGTQEFLEFEGLLKRMEEVVCRL